MTQQLIMSTANIVTMNMVNQFQHKRSKHLSRSLKINVVHVLLWTWNCSQTYNLNIICELYCICIYCIVLYIYTVFALYTLYLQSNRQRNNMDDLSSYPHPQGIASCIICHVQVKRLSSRHVHLESGRDLEACFVGRMGTVEIRLRERGYLEEKVVESEIDMNVT